MKFFHFISCMQQINLVNFKQFRNAQISPNQGINLIIGHNGEGKSNLLHAINLVLNNSDNTENCITTAENIVQAEISCEYNDKQISRIITSNNSQIFINNKQVSKAQLEQAQIPCLFIGQSQTDVLARLSPQELFEQFQQTIQIKNYDEKRENVINQLQNCRKKREEAEFLLKEFEDKVQDLKLQADEFEEFQKVSTMAQETEALIKQLDIQEIQLQIQADEGAKQSVQNELTSLQQKISVDKEKQAQVTSQIEDQQIQYQNLQVDVEVVKERFQKLVQLNYEEGEVESNQVPQLQQQLSVLDQDINTQSQQVLNLQQKLENTVNQKSQEEINAEIQKLQEDAPILQDQIKASEQTNNNQKFAIEELINKVNELKTQVRQAEGLDIYKQQSQLNTLIFKQERLLRKKQDIEFQIDKSFQDIFALHSSKQTIAIKHISEQPGYVGLLGELISVDEQLFSVLENAAGHLLMQVVVRTQDDAMNMISQLQILAKANEEIKGARVNFLVLEEFKDSQQKSISFQSQIQSQENAVTLSSLIQCDEDIKKIIDAYLSRVLIVRSFSLANEFSQQFQCDCYTIEGDCVLASGIINAGYHSCTKVKLFSQIMKLKQERDKILEQLQQIDLQMKVLQDQISVVQSKILQIEQQNDKLHSEIQKKQEEIQKLDVQQHEEERKLKELTQIYLQKQQQINNLKSLSQFSQVEDVNALKKKIIQMQVLVEQKSQEKSLINNKLQQLLQSQKSDPFLALQLVNTIRQQYGYKSNIMQNMKQLLLLKEQSLHDLTFQIQELCQKEVQLSRLVQQNQTKINDLENEVQQLSDQIYLRYNQVQQFQRQLMQLKTQPQMEEVSQTRAQLQQQLQTLNQKMKTFSSTNQLVFEQYRLQQEKFESGQKDLNELTRAEKEIGTMVGELESKHKHEVQTNFALVNQQFKQIFKYLTNTDGELEMKGRELYVRAFDGDFAQLSGGQLAVTSLSLLLSFNSTESFSLIMLDEPDSNLDQATRLKLAELLKQKAHKEKVQVFLTSFKKEMLDKCDSLFLVSNGQIQQVNAEEVSDGVWG